MPQISSSYVIAIITPSLNHYKSAKNFLGFIRVFFYNNILNYFNFESFKLFFTLVFNRLLGSLCIHIHSKKISRQFVFYFQITLKLLLRIEVTKLCIKYFHNINLKYFLMLILEQLFTSEAIYTLNNDETLPTKIIFLIKVIHMFTTK
jgi:hypothetical protein